MTGRGALAPAGSYPGRRCSPPTSECPVTRGIRPRFEPDRGPSSPKLRTFHIRTYGCQMNEHDSERIAGCSRPTATWRDDPEGADVVVFNTCCIRENADNRLYGNLGHLRALKEAGPGMQIAVAGCLAQKDREQIMACPQVDVVFGTHNVGRAAALLGAAAESGPIVEILEETALEEAEAFPSALPAVRGRPTPPG